MRKQFLLRKKNYTRLVSVEFEEIPDQENEKMNFDIYRNLEKSEQSISGNRVEVLLESSNSDIRKRAWSYSVANEQNRDLFNYLKSDLPDVSNNLKSSQAYDKSDYLF